MIILDTNIISELIKSKPDQRGWTASVIKCFI